MKNAALFYNKGGGFWEIGFFAFFIADKGLSAYHPVDTTPSALADEKIWGENMLKNVNMIGNIV